MHAVFIPYGKEEWVQILLRDIQAQKLPLRLFKEGEKDRNYYIDCQLRRLPFGFYEFIFPREYLPVVVETMGFHLKDPSSYSAEFDITKEFSIMGFKFSPLNFIKKFLKLTDPPENKEPNVAPFLWIRQFVGIIPVGIRDDKDITEPEGSEFAGWTHEAI